MNADELYQRCFVWDDHAGIEMHPDTPLDPLLSPWREAGVDYLSISVFYDAQPWTHAIQNIAAIRRRLEDEAPYCRIVGSIAEIDRAHADGKMAVTFDIEGMNALNGQADMVQLYYCLGVRHMNFAYNRNNLAGSGCHDVDTGLTDFGRRVIDEMNRIGMVVDCTHAGFKTTMAAIERSSAPVVFTHSNPKALVDHGRNITDAQITACAKTGGVIGINGINLFLGEEVATAATVARHAAYVAELTGPEHVALCMDYAPGLSAAECPGTPSLEQQSMGSDTDYWPPSEGYSDRINCLDVRNVPDVIAELMSIGFSVSEIEGLLGGNCRRIAEQVWKPLPE